MYTLRECSIQQGFHSIQFHYSQPCNLTCIERTLLGNAQYSKVSTQYSSNTVKSVIYPVLSGHSWGMLNTARFPLSTVPIQSTLQFNLYWADTLGECSIQQGFHSIQFQYSQPCNLTCIERTLLGNAQYSKVSTQYSSNTGKPVI